MTHPARCRCRRGGGRRCVRGGGLHKLCGHALCIRHASDFEVVTAAAQIDHIVIVCILQDAGEVAITEALAVASQQIARLGANDSRTNRGLADGKRFHRAPHEVEGLVARESLATRTDLLARC